MVKETGRGQHGQRNRTRSAWPKKQDADSMAVSRMQRKRTEGNRAIKKQEEEEEEDHTHKGG